jgi:hypothetical protein
MKTKRKRGGQKGNQNARKHGFYAAGLSLPEICEFWNTINRYGGTPEIVALRIKLKSALLYVPGNKRLLREASRLLVKWYCCRYYLDKKDAAAFKKVVRDIIENINDKSADSAGTNRI